MKPLGLAMNMYQQDYDGTLMQTTYEDPTLKIHWSIILQPYVNNVGIIVCPSDALPVIPEIPCAAGQIAGLNCDAQVPKFSYINNYNAIPAHDWLAPSEAAFEEPASLIVLAEPRAPKNDSAKTKIGQWKGTSAFIGTSGVSVGSGQICPRDAYRFATPADATTGLLGKKDKPEIVRLQYDRHTGGANYTFADGHAKWHRFEQTLDPNNFLWGKTWYQSPFQNTPQKRPCP